MLLHRSVSVCCGCDPIRWCVQGRVTDVDPAAVMALTEGGAEEESAGWLRDPLHAADVGGAAVGTLVSLMHADRGYFDASLSELNETERTYLQSAFQNHSQGTAEHA